MTTVHERRKNELQDALNITEQRIATLTSMLWFMPSETEAQLRRVEEVIDERTILITRATALTERLNALTDTE